MAGFGEILGNEPIKQHFKLAMANDKVSHSYMLAGEKGMGKKMIAKAFAMALLCENKTDGLEPCMKCRSCIQALSENNPDIVFVRHEKPKLVSVQDIRTQLVADIGYKPYSYKHKVYIVEDAQFMNIEAQNAMLKTIEEPPSYAVIILLVTNTGSMLQTVLSRTVVLNVQPIKKEIVKEYLMKNDKIVDYQADVAASFAGGNLGKAKEIAASEQFRELMEEVKQLLRYIKDMQAYEVVAAVKRASEYKVSFDDYLDLLTLWFRDVLLFKASQDANSILFKEEIKTIKQHAASSSYNGIEEILSAIEKAKTRLKCNVNFDTTIELLFLTIRDNI